MWLKYFFYTGSLIILLFFQSCGSSDSTKVDFANTDSDSLKVPHITELNLDTLKGIYIGDFGGSDIRIVINYISNKHAVGYSLHKGLQRNISGSVEITDETVNLILAEPEDHEFDGIFHIDINQQF